MITANGLKTRFTRFFSITFFLCYILSLSPQSLSSTNNKSEILLQGFDWESFSNPQGWYNHLLSKVDDFADLGFTQIWLPPPTYSYDGEGIFPNSRGYIPLEYYNLNSAYGSIEELKSLIITLKQFNISPLADLVINHRGKHAGTSNIPVFSNPDWDLRFFTGGPGMPGLGAPDTGAKTDYAYDLDFTNSHVVEYLASWMNWLKDEIGFEGWRYDFAKGYAGKYVGILNRLTNPKYSIGEYWTNMDFDYLRLGLNQDRHRQKIMNWIDSTWKEAGLPSKQASAAFDFTTKGILQTAIQKGEFWRLLDTQSRPPGAIGLWPNKSYTFIDNHDTGSTQNHWPFGNRESIMQGYVYILTHPGVPTVFWDHLYNLGLYHQIKTLMRLRIKYSIKSDCSIYVLKAQDGLYAATINDKITIKLGTNPFTPDGNWSLVITGFNYSVWEKL